MSLARIAGGSGLSEGQGFQTLSTGTQSDVQARIMFLHLRLVHFVVVEQTNNGEYVELVGL